MSHGHHKQPFLHHFLAGGIAGVTEILIMYPTDVVKTRAQLSTGKAPGMISTFTEIISREGPSRLYRGILPPIFIEAPKRSIKFSANETYKSMYRGKDGTLSQQGAALAGVSAGLTEAFIVVPFELVKVRLQDKANIGLYNGTGDAVSKILRNEGPLAFYKGLESTLWRNGFWNGGYFGVIDFVRRTLPKPQTEGQTLRNNFIAGFIGGTVGTILNTPFDVVKSRIQNQKPGVNKYNWTLPAVVTVAREEGVLALYKGFVPKVVRLGPGGGILLLVFDRVSKFMRETFPQKH